MDSSLSRELFQKKTWLDMKRDLSRSAEKQYKDQWDFKYYTILLKLRKESRKMMNLTLENSKIGRKMKFFLTTVNTQKF